MNDTVRPVYEKMLEYANLAIKCNTGIAFTLGGLKTCVNSR